MENTIEIYTTADNQTEIKVQFDADTVWLNQKQMAELFDKDTDTIGLHLKNIYSESELNELSTTEFFSVVQQEGKRSVQTPLLFSQNRALFFIVSLKGSENFERFL